MNEPLNGDLWRVDQGDCLAWLASLPEQSCDLVFGSPPYVSCRLYLENGENLGIARNAEEWSAWMVDVIKASLRVCRGLVAFVVEGQTKDYRYDAAPLLLMADLHRAGVHLRKPPIYRRVGIPGSGGSKKQHAHQGGGADWLRNDYEFIVCATNGGKLPWADGTAMGHAPKWAPGGEMSHRLSNGQRVNGEKDPWMKRGRGNHIGGRQDDGTPNKGTKHHTKRRAGAEEGRKGRRDKRVEDGTREGATEDQVYIPPVLANPGNVVQELYTAEQVANILGEPTDVIDCKVGGGQMGSALVHANEAGFPERLCEFFIRSFCPENGIVIDPFSGSGTTAAVAVRWGRCALCCDLRQSQVELSRRRIKEAEPGLFTQRAGGDGE